MSLWETFRSWLTNPLISGVLGGLIVILLAYIDSKFREEERESETYWKLFIVSSLVIATLTYLVSEEFYQRSKTDEFLNQTYETNVPELVPKKKGGTEQPVLSGPKENLMEGMNKLKPMEVEIISPSHIKHHKKSHRRRYKRH
jgi:hypothetical protein